MQCAQIAAGLADAVEAKELHEAQDGYARSVLSYYVSSFHLIPDILPGIGFLDEYLMLVSAMWICETEVKELDYGALMRQPYRIGKLLEVPKEPSLADLALDAAREKKEQLKAASNEEGGESEKADPPKPAEKTPEERAAEKAQRKRDRLDEIRRTRRETAGRKSRQSPFANDYDEGDEE